MKTFIANAIYQYQKIISPIIKKTGLRCLYKTTCSEYCLECFRKYNFFEAFLRCGWRIASCNPINAYLISKRVRDKPRKKQNY